jgi:hypothetical protein
MYFCALRHLPLPPPVLGEFLILFLLAVMPRVSGRFSKKFVIPNYPDAAWACQASA